MAKWKNRAKATNTMSDRPADPTTPTSVCRVCGESGSEFLRMNNVVTIDGETHQWIRVRCLGCGQVRTDHIVRPAITNKGEDDEAGTTTSDD